MKISKISTFALEQELPINEQFAFSQIFVKKRTVLICKIETDEGLIGWGESFGPAKVHKTIIDNYYTPYLIGKNIFDTQVIWDYLYNFFRDNGQKGVTVQSLSAIDIALWDLKGKATGLPIYQLMGGTVRERVRPYATGMYRKYTSNEIEETVEEAVSCIAEGFTAIKIKTGFDFDYDVNVVREIRNAVGDDISIMVDANHGYNAMEAIKVGRALETYNLTWYEEPVPPEDHEGYLEVKRNINIPIAGGEAEFTRYGIKPLLDKRCVDILQPDCTITGGLSEFIKITTLCSIANIQCIPHIWGSGIALATGIHAAFFLPDFPQALETNPVWLEYDRTSNIFREKLASGIPKMKDGWLEKPIEPGLGIQVDENMLEYFAL